MHRDTSSVKSSELESTSSRKLRYAVMAYTGYRKMLVFNGMIYYCSSGDSSGLSNVWFPMLFIRGTQPIDYDAFPSYLIKEKIEACPYDYLGYFVKFSTDYCADRETREKGLFKGADLAVDELAARLPTKEAIIVSARLSGQYFPRHRLDEVDLTEEEKFLTTQPLCLQEEETMETTNPDTMNNWLIKRGAMIANAVLKYVSFRLSDDCLQRYYSQGMTPFMIAVVNGRRDLLHRYMPQENVEIFVNRARRDGWTPLMLAAESGHAGVVTFLLQCGANMDQALPNGATASMIAKAHRRHDIVKILANAKNEQQQNPDVTHPELKSSDPSVSATKGTLFSESKKPAVENPSQATNQADASQTNASQANASQTNTRQNDESRTLGTGGKR